MLEPFIKIKQENNVKNFKLKKIDLKLSELKECQKQLIDNENELKNQDSESLNNDSNYNKSTNKGLNIIKYAS
jgi:hypothetical protein